jgi:hypothetical protein
MLARVWREENPYVLLAEMYVSIAIIEVPKKKKPQYRTGDICSGVEYMLTMHKALSSNPSTKLINKYIQ